MDCLSGYITLPRWDIPCWGPEPADYPWGTGLGGIPITDTERGFPLAQAVHESGDMEGILRDIRETSAVRLAHDVRLLLEKTYRASSYESAMFGLATPAGFTPVVDSRYGMVLDWTGDDEGLILQLEAVWTHGADPPRTLFIEDKRTGAGWSLGLSSTPAGFTHNRVSLALPGPDHAGPREYHIYQERPATTSVVPFLPLSGEEDRLEGVHVRGGEGDDLERPVQGGFPGFSLRVAKTCDWTGWLCSASPVLMQEAFAALGGLRLAAHVTTSSHINRYTTLGAEAVSEKYLELKNNYESMLQALIDSADNPCLECSPEAGPLRKAALII